ncbi:MAG: phosphoribosylglycinamide formyltransferase [Rhodospirillaceae bacterium]|nr:phosphoribosylglycinamide formyltransferase [Rhodospirillaceae bacterium]
MLRLAVLFSGRGSNLLALIDACREPGFPAVIVHVISNNHDAQGLTHAREAGIQTTVLDHRTYVSREEFDAAVTEVLENAQAEVICLAGFMRILTEGFIERWYNRLLNIHPSLLPAFKGLDAQQQALDAGVKLAGCSVHFVRPCVDEGPIIAQAAVPVLKNDDIKTLSARILAVEHRLYPRVIRLIAEGRVKVVDGRAVINNSDAPKGALFNPSHD